MNRLTLPRHIKNLRSEQAATPLVYEHPQISFIIDTLRHYERHHLLLVGSPSEKINFSFIEGLLTQLPSDTPFFYYDCRYLLPEETHNELTALQSAAENSQKPAILVINQLKPLVEDHFRLIKPLLFDKQWRVIILSDSGTYKQALPQLSLIDAFFSVIQVAEPSEATLIALLKSYRLSLENFHQVTIPEDTVSLALTLANRYLHSTAYFDKAFELLDSAAARAHTLEHANRTEGPSEAIVTPHLLAEIVSQWTQIPCQTIQKNPFQAASFMSAMQQPIFGQESAISLIASVLQQTYVHLYEHRGPLSSFLFSGQADVGKTELALHMTSYLLGSSHALLQVSLDKNIINLADIKIINHRTATTLLEAIQQTPYAIILIDDIQPEQMLTLNLFKEIFTRGYVIEQGIHYDFSHAIVIMTTRIASESLERLIHPHHLQAQAHTSDLLQLVLNENVLDIPEHMQPTLSIQELCDELTPHLEKHFPIAILQNAHIIPFVPLCFSALEKIIRLKIKILIKRLDTRFCIELNYAPEIIKFLAHEAYWRKPSKSLDKLLEQLLYSGVAHQLLELNQDKHRSKRLLLQLHENGHSLKCDFITESAIHRL